MQFARLIDRISAAGFPFLNTFGGQLLKPIWLKTLDALHDVISNTPGEGEKRVILEWELFGQRFMCDNRWMPLPLQQLRSQRLGNSMGCSWHRCILHKQLPHIRRIMFQDSNHCEKAQYCGGQSFTQGSMLCFALRQFLLTEVCQRRWVVHFKLLAAITEAIYLLSLEIGLMEDTGRSVMFRSQGHILFG